jgi:hypothetical protein
MKHRIAALTLLFCTTVSAQAPAASAELAQCFKNPAARFNVIYLPGVDGVTVSKTELGNRKILDEVAKESKITIAVMRSKVPCPKRFPDSVCWPQDTAAQVNATIKTVLDQASSCLEKDKDIILLGFSNGGYLAGKLVQQCEKSPFKQVIAIGSAGYVPPSQADMRSCGKFTIMMGLKDKLTFQAAKDYYEALKKKNADVAFVTYEGAHTLTVKSLTQLFAN